MECWFMNNIFIYNFRIYTLLIVFFLLPSCNHKSSLPDTIILKKYNDFDLKDDFIVYSKNCSPTTSSSLFIIDLKKNKRYVFNKTNNFLDYTEPSLLHIFKLKNKFYFLEDNQNYYTLYDTKLRVVNKFYSVDQKYWCLKTRCIFYDDKIAYYHDVFTNKKVVFYKGKFHHCKIFNNELFCLVNKSDELFLYNYNDDFKVKSIKSIKIVKINDDDSPTYDIYAVNKVAQRIGNLDIIYDFSKNRTYRLSPPEGFYVNGMLNQSFLTRDHIILYKFINEVYTLVLYDYINKKKVKEISIRNYFDFNLFYNNKTLYLYVRVEYPRYGKCQTMKIFKIINFLDEDKNSIPRLVLP